MQVLYNFSTSEHFLGRKAFYQRLVDHCLYTAQLILFICLCSVWIRLVCTSPGSWDLFGLFGLVLFSFLYNFPFISIHNWLKLVSTLTGPVRSFMFTTYMDSEYCPSIKSSLIMSIGRRVLFWKVFKDCQRVKSAVWIRCYVRYLCHRYWNKIAWFSWTVFLKMHKYLFKKILSPTLLTWEIYYC